MAHRGCDPALPALSVLIPFIGKVSLFDALENELPVPQTTCHLPRLPSFSELAQFTSRFTLAIETAIARHGPVKYTMPSKHREATR
jgi:hypothetical protein